LHRRLRDQAGARGRLAAQLRARRRHAARRDRRPAGTTQGAAVAPDRSGHEKRHRLSRHAEMTARHILFTAALVLAPVALDAQLAETWPTHNGDYSGRRYSSLKLVDRTTVKSLSLAWVSRPREGAHGNVGGEGTIEFPDPGPPTIKASALMVDGVIYIST